MWKAQLPYLAERFRVISFYPRSNGKSDRPENPNDYSVDKIINDVVAVMNATDTETVVLVGMSFSSAMAFAFVANFPERVNAVVST